MADAEDSAYQAEERDGGWVVVDVDGRVICSCGAAPNARHYETLLNPEILTWGGVF